MYEKYNPPKDEFKNLAALKKKSALSFRDLAPLFRVSYESVKTWSNTGEGPQQELIREHALKALGILEAAIAAKDLPLKGVPHEERRAALDKVWAKHA